LNAQREKLFKQIHLLLTFALVLVQSVKQRNFFRVFGASLDFSTLFFTELLKTWIIQWKQICLSLPEGEPIGECQIPFQRLCLNDQENRETCSFSDTSVHLSCLAPRIL